MLLFKIFFLFRFRWYLLNSFKSVSLNLTFCHFNMICLGLDFCCCYLYCLAFSELYGLVLWCLSLILERSQSLLLQRFLLYLFLFVSFWYTNYTYIRSFEIAPWYIWAIFILFSISFFFSFSACLKIFSWLTFKLINNFLSCVQSTHEHSKSIIYATSFHCFWYIVLF